MFENTDVSAEFVLQHLHPTLRQKKEKRKKAPPGLIGFVLFITLISTSLLSPLQMRGRWGGSGFDDLKCTELTSYSYPAQLLRHFNCFFLTSRCSRSARLSRVKQARGLCKGFIVCQKRSSLIPKSGHNLRHSPGTGRIYCYSYLKIQHVNASLSRWWEGE